MAMADWVRSRAVLSILQRGPRAPEAQSFLESCERYFGLCSTWNLSAKLMSKRDLEQRFDEHVADSLTLYPYLTTAVETGASLYVDIGSGAGFPAIPLLLAGIDCRCVMVERSERKAEFLRQSVKLLSLPDTEVMNLDLDRWDPPHQRVVVTARATDDPAMVDARICRHLGHEGVYLAQRTVDLTGADLHSIRIADNFGECGYRRSVLNLVARADRLRKFHVEPFGVG